MFKFTGMKKALKSIIVSTFLIGLIFGNCGNVSASGFKDVPNSHWAKADIEYLASRGVINGYNNGMFKPNQSVTNAQVAIMLVRALKLNTNGRPNPNLSDVYSTQSGFKEIATAIDEGIFPKESKFNPNAPISRASMARAIANAFNVQSYSYEVFADVSSSHWAYPYISSLASNLIATGYEDGTFRPNNSVTRAQFSAFVVRALKVGKDSPNQSVVRGVEIGMTKQQVKQIETSNLTAETATELFYDDASFQGLPANVTYVFDSSNRLSDIYILANGEEHFTVEELELLFQLATERISVKYGLPDKLDENWYDDKEHFVLQALWLGTPDVYLNVKVNEYTGNGETGILFTISSY